MRGRVWALAALLALTAFAPSEASAWSMMDMTKATAERELNQFVRLWSSNRGVRLTLGAIRRYYANPTLYYGRRLTHKALLRDKRRFAVRFPVRHYRIVSGTVSSACDPRRALACNVGGLLRFDRRAPSGRQVAGAACLSLTITRASGDRVARQSATPVPRAGRCPIRPPRGLRELRVG